MVKTKLIKEAGQVLKVDDENEFIQRKKQPKEIIEVSYSEAKKLAKKPMSDKQKENVAKLVEANRLKWEAKKKAAEEANKAKEEEEDQRKTSIVVKPKRVYPPRTKQAPKQDPKYEDEYEDLLEAAPRRQRGKISLDESDESEPELERSFTKEPPRKVKAEKAPKQKNSNVDLYQQNQELMNKLQKLKQIDEALIRMQPADNKYLNLLKNRW